MSKGLSGLKPKTQGLGSNRPPRQPKRTFGGSDGTFVPWTGVLFGAQRTAQCVSCAPCRNADPSTLRQRSLSKGRWVCVSARCTRNALGSALSPKKHSSPGHEGAIAAAKRPLGLARRPVRPKALGFGLETAKAFAHQSSFEEDHFRGRLIDQRCIAGV